jgi:predicted DNA-binding transcriptional regulator AlpA
MSTASTGLSDWEDSAPTGRKLAYSIEEFCKLHSISRPYFYLLLKAGKGPRVTRLGARRLVTVEDAATWRQAMAEASA